MIDLRYHLASIVAIFFALGLGMLMGAQLAHGGTLTEEHARIIEQIEASVERVRSDNRRLGEQLADVHARLKAEQAFIDDLLARIVEDRLGGVPVDIVVTAGSTSYKERVLSALQKAGADISVLDDVSKARPERGQAVTLFLWGETDGPDSGRWEKADAPSGGAGDEGVTAAEGLVRAVWGWPAAAARRSSLPTIDGVPFVEAVDTPGGLLMLIDTLRAEAGLTSDDQES